MTEELNCLACGACCKVFGCIEVYPSDGIIDQLTVPTELGYSRMRTNGFTCCCLDGNACLIYPFRPKVCRDFQVGGDLCLMARDQAKKLSLL